MTDRIQQIIRNLPAGDDGNCTTGVGDETCTNCAFVLLGAGTLPACANKDSEFYRGFVHPLGYCPSYKKSNDGECAPVKEG